MSFRPDSRESKSRSRLTARDQRLLHQYAGQKRIEEQETIIEEIEGPKSKKRSLGGFDGLPQTSPNPSLASFLQSQAEMELRVKKRIGKMKTNKKSKKQKSHSDMWDHLGPTRSLIKMDQWERLGKDLPKINHYEG